MIPGPTSPRAGRLGWWVVVGLVALITGFWLAERTVDWLWMGTLGYRPVFWGILDLRLALFAAAFVALALYFWLNLRWALQVMAAWRRATGAAPDPALAGLERSSLLRWALPCLFAFLLAIGFAGAWDDAIRFFYGATFGIRDPLLGLDAGFYVFRLPLLDAVVREIFFVALAMLLAQAGLGVGLGVFRGWARLDDTARGVMVSAPQWTLGIVGLAAAAGYLLDRFRLLYASSGTVWGPGYVEAQVVMPALWIMAAITLAATALAVVAARRHNLRLVAWGIGGAVGAHVVLLGILPSVIQAVYVDPNEVDRERPYLAHNIAFTRMAFGIDGVSERTYPAAAGLGLRELADNRDTIRNIRLWDYRPLLRTFRQIQQIRLYYQFYDVDVDRYQLADGYRQTMLAARELTPELPERAETWVNRHLQYTHGYGLAMSLAAQEGEEGTPTLVIGDLPPVATRGAPAGNPALYYGEHMPDYVIAPSGIREFDHPSGDDNVYASYRGAGGVPLGSFWSRLLFAVHLMDVNLLLTDYTVEGSRIHIRRSLQDRVHRIAPFLRLDRDPYIVTTPEGISWIQDAYTTSDHYPYSERYRPAEGEAPFNYIRNSVKIVMDAYDGSVAFHVMDPEDPVLAAYRRAFPELFRPLADLPAGLRAHLRYPQDLFQAQVTRYAAYHMQDPQVFYNKEDLWTLALEKFGEATGPMEPYYVLMRLPGEERLEFMLMLPMTPQGRDNLIAWVAARSDFPDYGQIVTFKLPKERLIYGPMQVEALIDQNTEISRQLALWDQGGSRVLRGNLLVIPIDHSLLYVEPVYLVAEQNDLPQLKRMIVAHGGRVAMEPSLDAAIAALFGAPEPASPAREAARDPALLRAIRAGLADAENALARGDWTGFGAAMNELKRAVEQGPATDEAIPNEGGSP
jgi:uncharacterized membrane protein (UPF0182 family)